MDSHRHLGEGTTRRRIEQMNNTSHVASISDTLDVLVESMNEIRENFNFLVSDEYHRYRMMLQMADMCQAGMQIDILVGNNEYYLTDEETTRLSDVREWLIETTALIGETTDEY
jgi:hypothetical protein